jgi:hypothetical protein
MFSFFKKIQLISICKIDEIGSHYTPHIPAQNMDLHVCLELFVGFVL